MSFRMPNKVQSYSATGSYKLNDIYAYSSTIVKSISNYTLNNSYWQFFTNLSGFNINVPYTQLSIVLYNGNYYYSRVYVPQGQGYPNIRTDYWCLISIWNPNTTYDGLALTGNGTVNSAAKFGSNYFFFSILSGTGILPIYNDVIQIIFDGTT